MKHLATLRQAPPSSSLALRRRANGVPGDGNTGETDDDPSAVAGTWAEARTGTARPADDKARLITQAAAAAALLQFAYIDKVKNAG